MIKSILLAFVPIFVAVDAIATLPIFISLTQGLQREEKVSIIGQSVITALLLAVGFIFLGKAVFMFLGIKIGDFMVAGGSILFFIAIKDIMNPGKQRRLPAKDLGVVPLGTPLIVGPAVLATSLIIIEEYGYVPTLIAIFFNVIIAGLLFLFSETLVKKIGEAGTKAISKVTCLLLAAIGFMLIRKGLVQLFTG